MNDIPADDPLPALVCAPTFPPDRGGTELVQALLGGEVTVQLRARESA